MKLEISPWPRIRRCLARQLSVHDGDGRWTEGLAARPGKQGIGVAGDEREAVVGRLDRKDLDLVVDVVQGVYVFS